MSIGLPVYNEVTYIEETLKSLLALSYPNIEIIISDNASADGTFDLCQKLCREVENVALHRFSENKGATANFQYVLGQAKGKYFMWASGHDLWAPNLIDSYVRALEDNPDANIAFSSAVWIDQFGKSIDKISGWSDTRGMGAMSRFFTILWGNMHPLLGLIRRASLNDINKIGSFIGADLALLADLSLKGEFLYVTETKWFRREFRKELDHSEKMERYRREGFIIRGGVFSWIFPMFGLPMSLIGIAIRSNLPIGLKFWMLTGLVFSLPARYIAGKRRL